MFEVIQESFAAAIDTMIQYLPAILAALIILLIGWLIGRALGKLVSKLLSKARADQVVDKTIVGETLKRAGMTTAGFFDAIVRWFIYIIFIMAAINVLNIPMLADYMNQIALYIPHLIVGIIALVIGLILINIVMRFIENQLKAQKVPFAHIIATVVRALLFLVVIVFALDQLLIDTTIIYSFITPIAWGIAVGLAVAIGIAFGWGSKDSVAKYIAKKLKTK